MRPMTVITGILLVSCLSITVSLAAVLIVFLILGDDYPRLRHEFRPLLLSMVIFLAMTITSAMSFYSLIINHRIRHWLQGLMWVSFLTMAWYYWP